MTLSRLVPLLLITSAFGCRSKETPTPAPVEKTQAAAETLGPEAKSESPPAAPSAPPADAGAFKGPPPGSMELVGPPLWITPGKGIGAIFFGAYEETVTRKMGAPCQLTKIDTAKTADAPETKRCAYVDRGLVFRFEGGVLAGIHIHRRDREVRDFGLKEPRYFGTFKGGAPPNTVIGLHKHIVEEEYGKAKKDERLKETGPDGLVALGHYPGMTFEYDELKNGNTVLSGFVVEPDAQSKKLIETAKKAKRDAKGG